MLYESIMRRSRKSGRAEGEEEDDGMGREVIYISVSCTRDLSVAPFRQRIPASRN